MKERERERERERLLLGFVRRGRERERVWVLRKVGYGAVPRTWEVFKRVTQIKCECETDHRRRQRAEDCEFLRETALWEGGF